MLVWGPGTKRANTRRAGGDEIMRSKSERLMRSAALSDGFTVIEFVAAAAILFIVLVGILGAVQYAGAATRMASIRQGAIDVAQEQIETDRTRVWTDIGVVGGNPAGTIPASQTIATDRAVYTVSTNVAWNTDPDSTHTVSTREISVKVAWGEPQAGSVSLETAVYGTGTTGNTGNIQVVAVDVDHKTVKLQGITFALSPNGGGWQNVITNTDGQALWGQVKTGQIVALKGSSISSDWLVDVSGIISPTRPTVASGWNDWGFVYCQKPCTANFHVKNTSGVSLPNYTVTLKNLDSQHPSTYTATTDADGNVEFSSAAGTVNGDAGLWTSNDYSVVASWGSATSTTTVFALSVGGQNYSGDLVVLEPPHITVSLVATGSLVPLTGRTWTVTLKNPSGTSLGTFTTSDDSFAFPISVAGNYTVIVTNVVGFLDNPGFLFTATLAGPNNVAVPLSPLFLVGVRASGTLISVPATVTMEDAVSGDSVQINTSTGLASFAIPADGNYNVYAMVNMVSYPLSGILQKSLVVASPPLDTFYVDFLAGGLSVTVNPKPSSGSRKIGIYDTSGALVAQGSATKTAPTVEFTLPGGDYTVAVCKSGMTPPATLPSGTNYRFVYPTVPTDGGTVSVSSPAPN
jgi:type II secretory pathway pseudopilin PulG